MNQDFNVTRLHRIIAVGKEAYPDSHAVFSSHLDCNELIFHFSGQTTVFFDGKPLKTGNNTIRFLPKGDVSGYEVFIEKPDECILIAFDTDLPVSDGAFVSDAPQNESIAPLFKKIFARWAAKEDGYYFECASLLYKILAEMQRIRYAPTDQWLKIKPAVDAILRDFLREDISIGSLAALCNISESYFKRLFKKRYGIPPKQYMIRLKINHACDLLRLGRHNVTQIAEMSGFSDVYYFSRKFKEYTGITPTRFAKESGALR